MPTSFESIKHGRGGEKHTFEREKKEQMNEIQEPAARQVPEQQMNSSEKRCRFVCNAMPFYLLNMNINMNECEKRRPKKGTKNDVDSVSFDTLIYLNMVVVLYAYHFNFFSLFFGINLSDTIFFHIS